MSTFTFEAKLRKLSQSIEGKLAEIDKLREQENKLNEEITSSKTSLPHALILPELKSSLAALEYELAKSEMKRDTLAENIKVLENELIDLEKENEGKEETVIQLMVQSKLKFYALYSHCATLLEAVGAFEERSLMASEDLQTNLELCRLSMQTKGQSNEQVEWLKRLLKTCESERVDASRLLDRVESEFQQLQRNQK